jgi:hypothetical protein
MLQMAQGATKMSNLSNLKYQICRLIYAETVAHEIAELEPRSPDVSLKNYWKLLDLLGKW